MPTFAGVVEALRPEFAPAPAAPHQRMQLTKLDLLRNLSLPDTNRLSSNDLSALCAL